MLNAKPEDVTELVPLLEWTVSDDQIDHNGHMGMTFYALKGGEASIKLVGQLGFNAADDKTQDIIIQASDTYIRYYREQMLGASLLMVGGVVSVAPDTLTMYHELYNQENGELSAVVTQRVVLRNRNTREVHLFPEDVQNAAQEQLIDVPEHGLPRSIKLGDPGSNVAMAELERRGLESGQGGWGKPGPQKIEPEDCDKQGFLQVAMGLGISWRRAPSTEDMENDPQWLEHKKRIEESKIGWVALENRVSIFAHPRSGDELSSFSAAVAVKSKTRLRKVWTFNNTTGELAGVHQQVDLAFDLVNRKGVVITPEMLSEWGEGVETDLA